MKVRKRLEKNERTRGYNCALDGLSIGITAVASLSRHKMARGIEDADGVTCWGAASPLPFHSIKRRFA